MGERVQEMDDAEEQYPVEAIVGKKMVGGKEHYLVRWMGYPDEDSWEPANTMCKDAPDSVNDFEVTGHCFLTSQIVLVADSCMKPSLELQARRARPLRF